MRTHLSLFTGIGGLDLAAEWAGFTTVGQCEWADFPTKVLEKNWPNFPPPGLSGRHRWRDIRTLTGEDFYARTGLRTVDVVSGGFPCQPHSLCGERLASRDKRDLWDEYARVVREIRPQWVVGENVYGLLSSDNGRFFGRILGDLAEMGYSVGWCCYPARWVGADFEGERVFIVAASDGLRRRGMAKNHKREYTDLHHEILHAKKTDAEYIPLHVEWAKSDASSGYERDDDGLSEGVDRLTALGNAVVPQQAYPIFKAIMEELERNGE